MRVRLNLIGKSGNVLAAAWVDWDLQWIPLDLADEGKMAQFLPREIARLSMRSLDGQAWALEWEPDDAKGGDLP